jgi:phosphopantothenoylcysteine synthetase/decarboxylase
MTHPPRPPVLYLVVCAAGPAAAVTIIVSEAITAGWDVHIIATPSALGFLDPAALETATGHPVRSEYRQPGTPRQARPPADAIIVAPATFNTITKLAAGISDNYALGILAEAIGNGIPIAVLPFINTALAQRAPLSRAVLHLRDEGVDVLLGPPGFEPHPPGQGYGRVDVFPWSVALATVTSAL